MTNTPPPEVFPIDFSYSEINTVRLALYKLSANGGDAAGDAHKLVHKLNRRITEILNEAEHREVLERAENGKKNG